MAGSEVLGGKDGGDKTIIKYSGGCHCNGGRSTSLGDESSILVEDAESSTIFSKGAPRKKYNSGVVVPGKDKILGVDSVGTVPSSLLTYAAGVALRPDLIFNAGTAGGFQAKGVGIGYVYVATEFANHDRRIPIPV